MTKINFPAMENLNGGYSCFDPSNGHWHLPAFGCPGICLALSLSGASNDPLYCF